MLISNNVLRVLKNHLTCRLTVDNEKPGCMLNYKILKHRNAIFRAKKTVYYPWLTQGGWMVNSIPCAPTLK